MKRDVVLPTSPTPTAPQSSSPLHRLAFAQKPRFSFSPLRLYLILFNSISFVGWLYISALTMHHLLTSPSPLSTLHSVVFHPVLLVESLAVLEAVHSVSGVTRSPFLPTLLQVHQRNFVLWGIAYPVPSIRAQPGFALMVIAWCLVEVFRYPFYMWTLWSPATLPRWLIWLRYSLFIPLYPLGMAGELMCILKAIPVLWREGIWTLELPNTWNVSFDWSYYCAFDALMYLPCCPLMYLHMMKQRRTVMTGIDVADKLKVS